MSVAERRPALVFVVPVLDEAANLDRLFSGLRAAADAAGGFEASVVLVDDGSTDGTPDVARRAARGLDLTVLTHATNRGPGAAFGTAFEHLADRLGPGDVVVTMEGDNTSRAELVASMLRRAGEGYDVVFASPYMYGGGILHTGPLRVFLSHVANALVKEFLGVHGILTVSSFFRLYRVEALQRLQRPYGPRIVERTGFESMVELVMKMTYLRISISEVPMVLDGTLRAGRSKLDMRRTAMGYVALLGCRRRWERQARAALESAAVSG